MEHNKRQNAQKLGMEMSNDNPHAAQIRDQCSCEDKTRENWTRQWKQVKKERDVVALQQHERDDVEAVQIGKRKRSREDMTPMQEQGTEEMFKEK